MGQEYELQQVLYKVCLQVGVELEDEVVGEVVEVTREVVEVTREVVEVTREVVEVTREVVEVTCEVVEVTCEVVVIHQVMVVAVAVDDMLFASLHLGHDVAGIEDNCPAEMPPDKNAPPALFVVLSVDALLHNDPAHYPNGLVAAAVVAAGERSPAVLFESVQHPPVAVFDDAQHPPAAVYKDAQLVPAASVEPLPAVYDDAQLVPAVSVGPPPVVYENAQLPAAEFAD